MGFGSFLSRPFKDIGKAVKKVGGGVNKAVKKVGGGVNNAARAAVGKGRKQGGSIGPSVGMKKKLMPERDNSV